MSGAAIAPVPRMWHVTVTVTGADADPESVRRGLERLVEERPFLLTVRYRADRAEVRYWEQALAMVDAASLALRLWDDHRESAGLPRWEVVGLEVLDRETFHRRTAEGAMSRPFIEAGSVRPFDD